MLCKRQGKKVVSFIVTQLHTHRDNERKEMNKSECIRERGDKKIKVAQCCCVSRIARRLRKYQEYSLSLWQTHTYIDSFFVFYYKKQRERERDKRVRHANCDKSARRHVMLSRGSLMRALFGLRVVLYTYVGLVRILLL